MVSPWGASAPAVGAECGMGGKRKSGLQRARGDISVAQQLLSGCSLLHTLHGEQPVNRNLSPSHSYQGIYTCP